MGAITAVPEAFLKSKGVKNPKMVIYGAGIVLVAITGFLIYRAVKKRIDENRAGKYNSGKSYTEMTEELGSLNINKSNTTLSEGEATMIAQNLLEAMNMFGTDEDAIIDGLSKAQTADDLYLIIKKFGIKPYDGLGLSDTWLSNKVAAVMKNLSGWLREELSGSSLTKVKKIYSDLGVPF